MAEIGDTLQEARMHARIDIGEVESRTKIRARYLRALENEEWALLPGPVYIKSFLRTYADYLGLDSRMLVDEFKRQFEGPSEHELRPASSPRREPDRGARPPRDRLVPPWAVVGGVLVAVVVALYLIGSGTGGAGRSVATGSHRQPHIHHPRVATTPTTATTPTKPALARVKLVPTAEVWICAANQAGKLLIPGTIYTPGQTVPTLRGRAVLLKLGNSDVTMTADDKPYTVVASTGPIGLKVTPAGVSVLAAGLAPTCAG